MKDLIRRILVKMICVIFPIAKKKILFIGYYGAQYGCNPKYISEYFVSKESGWDVVWAFTMPKKYNIAGIRKARYLSVRYLYELCTAQVVVANYRMTDLFRKRNGQIYIQTWHSSLRLKMIEKDSEASLPAHYVAMAKTDSGKIDVLLSGCRFSTGIFERAFWYNGKILESGTPRCDVLFEENDERNAEIKARLGVSADTNILLYAPTFRKNNDLSCYNIDYSRLLDTLSETMSGKWRIIVRLHPHLKEHSNDLFGGMKSVLDVTDYDDIQELLMISDYLVSDYSGLIFDFMITRRPCVLYTPDLDEYVAKDRKLYFKIEELPFPLCKDNNELNEMVANLDVNAYDEKISVFLSRIGNCEDGKASKRVYDYIEQLITRQL